VYCCRRSLSVITISAGILMIGLVSSFTFYVSCVKRMVRRARFYSKHQFLFLFVRRIMDIVPKIPIGIVAYISLRKLEQLTLNGSICSRL
jgi:ABC-type phosphate/phosphonate transport system permease subunit